MARLIESSLWVDFTRSKSPLGLKTLPLLPTPTHLWRDATRLGQQCRTAGFNAGSLDLIIAALAIHHDAELISYGGLGAPRGWRAWAAGSPVKEPRHSCRRAKGMASGRALRFAMAVDSLAPQEHAPPMG